MTTWYIRKNPHNNNFKQSTSNTKSSPSNILNDEIFLLNLILDINSRVISVSKKN